MPTLNSHAGIPGHLWDGAIQRSAQNIPLLFRLVGIPAFGEGWGLYAETLRDELRLYSDDPRGRIGMIQSSFFRAARLVVDTGMHANFKRLRGRRDVMAVRRGAGGNPPNVRGMKACKAEWHSTRGYHQGQRSGKRPHQQAGNRTAPDQPPNIKSPLATREPSTQDLHSASADSPISRHLHGPRVEGSLGPGEWGTRCTTGSRL